MTQQSKIPANRINVEELQQSLGGGLELGDIGITPFGIDETKNTRRYLNGQVISQIQFEAFTSLLKEKVLTYANLSTTEENWQAEVTNSKLGQCGKFVIDDEAGTIRLPKVVNINSLQDLTLIGGIKAESLPNIDGGNAQVMAWYNDTATWKQGALQKNTTVQTGIGTTGSWTYVGATNFSASIQSSTYQDNAPVQQEAIQYPYFIQVATSSDEAVNITTEIQLNNPFSLLDYKWSEYELTNASWLLSNGTFHNGATYISVYELLQKIYNGTEIKEGVSVKLSTEEYTDYDFVLNTTDMIFRLPVKVLLASGNRVAGNGMTLGLTDGTHNFGLGMGYTPSSYSVASVYTEVYGTNVGTQTNVNQNLGNPTVGITTDSDKSGIETSSQDLYLYFYVGETVQDANVIAASQVLTKVANCIDRTSATDRETVVSWGMPDYSARVSVSFPYTAEYDCWAYVKTTGSTGSDNLIYVSGKEVYARLIATTSTTTSIVPMPKGETISVSGGGSSSCVICPCKGVN